MNPSDAQSVSVAAGVRPREVAALRYRKLRVWLRDNGAPLVMSLPGIVHLLIFAYLPMLGIIIAFKDYRFDKGIL